MLKNPFTKAMVRKYFEAKLPGVRLPDSGNFMVKCPFHDDSHASLSLNLDKGIWNCKACGRHGGILEWEKLSTGAEPGTAWTQISEIIGHHVAGLGKPEYLWVYTDEEGLWLFRKIRYAPGLSGKKQIFQERYNRERSLWERGLNGTRQVLYNLPAVVRANVVMVVEGEKCADRVNALALFKDNPEISCIATTAPGGSNGWRPDYGQYFTGKAVLIFPDNDKPGREYAEAAAKNAHDSGAYLVKVVELPGLAEGEDIYDYLVKYAGGEQLLDLCKKAKPWKPAPEPESEKFFIDAVTLASTIPDEIEWLVQGVIPKGCNGFIIADPKSLKSFSAVDLAIHLATGENWLGFRVPRRVRCAFLAREDAWQLTGWRIKYLMAGLQIPMDVAEELHRDYLLFNTRMQTANFALDSDKDLERLIRELQKHKTEFLVMDVFRMLFKSEENDNTEMQAVLERVRKIQSEVHCAIGIVHHARKEVDGSIFRRTRGASAIHGFMEWGIGMSTVNPDAIGRDLVRKMEFLTKYGSEPEPIYVKAEGGESQGWVKLVTCLPPNGKAKTDKKPEQTWIPH